jgi:hypothetical protein
MERYVVDDNKILTVTKDWLKPHSPCSDGYQWFLTKFPQGAEYSIVYKALRDDKRFSDASWLANKLFLSDDVSMVCQNEFLSIHEILDVDKSSTGYASRIAAIGLESTASAGPNSAICLAWHDGNRPRFSVAYVGENGIKENTFYKLDSTGNFVGVLA